MKNNIREMIKSAIEENAVSFKDTASQTLYTKVASKLQEQYKTVAQNLMRPTNETNNGTN
jgi:hypothetical protein